MGTDHGNPGTAPERVHPSGAGTRPAHSAEPTGANPGGANPGGPGRFMGMTRVVEVVLDASVHAPGGARRVVRDAIGSELGPVADTLLLLVSELVTNAVLHARSTATVRLDLGTDAVRVEVQDGEERLPGVVDPDVDREGGRGLQMVEQLADRYGWTRLGDGKSVWFELNRG